MPEIPHDSPQGNTATLLGDISHGNASAVDVVSSAIGAAADLAGAIGGVGAVIGIVSSLFGPGDQTQALLQQIAQTINNDFHQLNNDLGAKEISDRNTLLNQYISDPYAAFQEVVSSLNQNPPVTIDYKQGQVTICAAALGKLDGSIEPNAIWDCNFDWQTYWTDAGVVTTTWWKADYIPVPPPGSTVYIAQTADVGYGYQPPAINADGEHVLYYVYSLPTYAFAVMLFLSVAGAYDSNFVADQTDVLNQAVRNLQAKHDQILNQGFKTLVPSHWGVGGLMKLESGPATGLQILQPGVAPPNRGSVQYGALGYFGMVELYSGASSMVYNYRMLVDGVPPPNIDTLMYSKILLRASAQARKLYVSVGLDKVWNSIRTLHRLLGDEPNPPRRFDSWSFRNDAIPLMGLGARADGSFSVSALAELIRTTPPYDAPLPRPIGFRQLFT
jgi:hypothetical protein